MDLTLSAQRIVRDSATPYYAQLASILRAAVEDRGVKAHEQLPSEAEIERAYGVSRTVVRQALGALVREGLLYRRKGKGTFIAEPKLTAALLQTLTSFYDEMAARGHPPVSQVLVQTRVVAPKDVSSALALKDGTRVIKLRRLRFVDGVPAVLSISFLPYDLCPQLLNEDLTHVSLYGLIERKYGLEIVSGIRHIEAVAASRKEARLLQIKKGAPLLLVQSVTYLSDGRAVDCSVAKHRADRTRLETRLLRVRRELASAPATQSDEWSRRYAEVPSG